MGIEIAADDDRHVIIDFLCPLSEAGKLIEIDGAQPIEQVTAALMKAISKKK